MYFPEHHNLRLFLTHGTTVKSEADTQHRKVRVVLRNGLKELGVFATKRDLGAYHLFLEYGKRSGSKGQRSQAPQDNIGPQLGGTLDQPRRAGFCPWKFS